MPVIPIKIAIEENELHRIEDLVDAAWAEGGVRLARSAIDVMRAIPSSRWDKYFNRVSPSTAHTDLLRKYENEIRSQAATAQADEDGLVKVPNN